MLIDKTDVAAAGRAIYNEKIKGLMHPGDRGKMVVIDVNSGDYEVDHDDWSAMLRLLERQPDAFTWTEMVGYPAPYIMAGRITRSDSDPQFWADLERKKRDD